MTKPRLIGVDYAAPASSSTNVLVEINSVVNPKAIAAAMSRGFSRNFSTSYGSSTTSSGARCDRCKGTFPDLEHLKSHFKDSGECLQHFIHNL